MSKLNAIAKCCVELCSGVRGKGKSIEIHRFLHRRQYLPTGSEIYYFQELVFSSGASVRRLINWLLWHPQPYDCNCCSSIALPLITTTNKISPRSLSKTEASSQPVAPLSSNLNKKWFPKVGRKWVQQSSSSSTKSDPFNHYDSLCKHTSEWSVEVVMLPVCVWGFFFFLVIIISVPGTSAGRGEETLIRLLTVFAKTWIVLKV